VSCQRRGRKGKDGPRSASTANREDVAILVVATLKNRLAEPNVARFFSETSVDLLSILGPEDLVQVVSRAGDAGSRMAIDDRNVGVAGAGEVPGGRKSESAGANDENRVRLVHGGGSSRRGRCYGGDDDGRGEG
jgi:hypothetical protein